MKTKSTSCSAFFSLRASSALILCAATACALVTGTLLAFFRPETPEKKVYHGALTFQERVAYQRAIEEVYWRHRIWPTERPEPKPSLDAVMSQAQLEKKVHDYLRESHALEDYWQRPITSEELQAEMDHMAKRSRQPEVLRELFEALGNDPFVIAECLARPLLAERLFRSAMASQNASWAISPLTDSRKTHGPEFGSYTLPMIEASLKEESTCTDAWTGTTTSNAPTGRYAHTTVWTGSEMIVWGGFDGQTTFFNTGGRYTPSTDTWEATSITNAPSARGSHTAVWTGSEMIVWGGLDDNFNYVNTGGRYNPSSDSWVATSTAGAPEAREIHTSVWTGSEMIVWGGFSVSGTVNTGGKYNPSTDSWTATTTTSAPESRDTHTAIWTGNEMIVWGGEDGPTFLNTGGRYNPSTDSWVATSTTNAPEPRDFHTAVWTGSEMIVWGGYDNGSYWNTGGKYNPSTDSWTATNTTNAPTGRSNHTAVWTGSEMILWGGLSSGPTFLNTGGRYDPGTDGWTATSMTSAPEARAGHTAVWTGNEMILWGGAGASGVLNTGGRYCGQYPPPTPTPSPTPTITVTNTDDSGPGSLRQALADANDGDIIGFAVTGTIGLTSGELLVDKAITISGPGAENLAVNANAKNRVFHVTGGNVTISGLTITNGDASGNLPGGGAIYNDHSMLTVNNSTISSNLAGQGGGICNDGQMGGAALQINNSRMSGNSAGLGGAIFNNAEFSGYAAAQINSSSITGNAGAAIFSLACIKNQCGQATVQVDSSTLSGNSGGGIFADPRTDLEIANSTLSDNDTAVDNYYTGFISNSTLNESSGNDIHNEGFVTINNAVLRVGPSGHSIVNIVGVGNVKSLGYNLSSDDGGGYLTGPGDQINTDPMLGPLQDNGGPTFTHALLPGSSAIDSGDPNFTPPPFFDQRGQGFDRVRNNRIDIGSFEVQAAPRPSPTPRVHPTPRVRPTPRRKTS